MATNYGLSCLRTNVRRSSPRFQNSFWLSLRKNFTRWLTLNLCIFISEIVRHSAARVVSAIAAIEVSPGAWPQLLPFLINACSSSNISHREAGSYILFTILENIVDDFQDRLNQLFQIFSHLINDPESINVRIVTVRALGEIAQLIDIEDKAELVSWYIVIPSRYLNNAIQKAYQELVPAMIQVIGQTVETNNETGARQLFDVIESLLILVRSFLFFLQPVKSRLGSSSSWQTHTSTSQLPSFGRCQPFCWSRTPCSCT